MGDWADEPQWDEFDAFDSDDETATNPTPMGEEVLPHGPTASVMLEIGRERVRQKAEENWSVEHDDDHAFGELALAAACYAQPPERRALKAVPHHYEHNGRAQAGDLEWFPAGGNICVPRCWPWDGRWWKPSHQNRRRDLIKAAALIVAEIERLDRAAARPACVGAE